MHNKTVVDFFVEGARKGWNLGVSSIIPNVLMAFAIIQILKVTGLLDIIGKLCSPVMGVFGVPGEAVMVLLSSWMSMGGGVGVAASLYQSGKLAQPHIAILLPAIFLMGSQIQYMGRCLGTAGVQARFYPMLFGISIVNALVAMLVMRFII